MREHNLFIGIKNILYIKLISYEKTKTPNS